MSEEVKLERIPMPSKKPVVGNMLSVDKDQPLQSLMGPVSYTHLTLPTILLV